ncbi:hypothetical protein AUJ35_02015 [Candidatus Falkowbacteria bacterium CG1_02_41_21]|uniref:Zinc/iron-chelating domain-containing protein n=1 Tax=Candidatus Falkowbacteria bacterium CG1_02_41_21 TaxID=1805147 RepID=A0A1J4T9H5_9BACT|nr:MAG: hypothetical protein AUJ35_02015 [Candidatus Falkowbacteria bacterium CG1_02_41_21]
MTAPNNFKAKIKRTITSVLPVAKNRTGHCSNCGQCCYLPKKCLFLKIKGAKNYCSIYKIRPLNCRKYPRTEAECLTPNTCSFHFKKE